MSSSYCSLNCTASVWQGSGMFLRTCEAFQCIQTGVLYYLVLSLSRVGERSQSICMSVWIWHIFLSQLRCDSLLCVCHSGGRNITVTGQGFDLVQSVTMQVVGIGHSVSILIISSFILLDAFSQIVRCVGSWDSLENNYFLLWCSHKHADTNKLLVQSK